MALSTLNRVASLIAPLSGRILPSNLSTIVRINQLSCLRNRVIGKAPARSFNNTNRQYFQSKLSLWVGGAVAAVCGSLFLLYRRADFPAQVQAAKVFDYGKNVDDSQKTSPSERSRHFNFIADVVEKAAPAVVYIEIQHHHPYTGAVMSSSNGSGFIVRSDGLIVTNAHVVANKPRVVVKLHDGRILEGVVQHVDPVADLATIAINANDLPTLQFGRSALLRPGEWVVAMGSPLALSNTVTAGVVSSTHRGSRELGLHHRTNMEYIQTDASITVGNSGGPLVNLDGEVIGINTMKLDAGISFAIPSDVVEEFLRASSKKLETEKGWFDSKGQSSGRSKRRYMGITMLTLTPNVITELQQRRRDFPAEVTSGVLVWKVIVGSPADSGGLLPGDVLTSINGKAVVTAEDVYKAIGEISELHLVVLRRNQRLTLTIVPQDSE